MREQENRTRPSKTAAYLLPVTLYIFALLSLVVSAGFVIQNTYKQATGTAIARSAARADLAAELVANRLLASGQSLRTLAGFVQPLVNPPITPADSRPDNIESYLDKRVSSLKFVSELFVADANGTFFTHQ
jgi:hypothetical protein